jgi:peptidoglycan L-alanyl-D-glutamate endopeptidase CwlK
MILRIGSTEIEAIKAVQAKLGIDQDGDFGGLTDAAVKKFQKRNGLTEDGEVGTSTAAKMGIDLALLRIHQNN